MNREIEFRYYDPFNGCFSYSANFKNLAEFFNQYQLAADGENKPILEQYANRLDINGKKMFEGDIVRVRCDGGPYEIRVIRWNPFGVISLDYSSQALGSHETIGDTFEIIGNIHENPKLLER